MKSINFPTSAKNGVKNNTIYDTPQSKICDAITNDLLKY